MSAVADAPLRNGHGSKLDPSAYREAVKARMRKHEEGPDGRWRRVAPSEAEVDRFLLECRIYGLEPLAGQIYAAWEDGAMKTVAHIDGLRLLAERTGKYDGQDDPEWCDKDGNWTDYWTGEEHPLAARVRVHKKGAKAPTTGTANWCDFAPQSDVGEGSLWSVSGGKPAHMLSIRAEALALRKAFPSELSGLYTAEELGISPAAIGAGGEEPASPAAAVEVPAAASAPRPEGPVAPPVPAGGEEGIAVIVDAAAEQPSGAPARPQAKRTLAEALASAEYQKLRDELIEALFDQLPDRLTDEQSEILAAALAEAEEAGIAPVELEHNCKVALKQGKGNVEARSRALLEWISERRRKAKGEPEAAGGEPGAGAVEPAGSESPPAKPAAEPGQGGSLLGADPGPEGRE
jgi:hypothetical protein